MTRGEKVKSLDASLQLMVLKNSRPDQDSSHAKTLTFQFISPNSVLLEIPIRFDYKLKNTFVTRKSVGS